MKTLLSLLLLAQPYKVESKFEQVLPEPPMGKLMARSPGQARAVLLLHGLYPHPFSKVNVGKAHFREWQEPDARLVRELVRNADVFAFAYAQETPVEQVASGSSLGANIHTLREMGYTEIVLIGHSAGGLIAREFVEDNPDAGVTRVIQVCSPNAGSSWANLSAVRKNQLPFVKSLTKDFRRKVVEARQGRLIPENVQFVCVVGTGAGSGDGVVKRESQWSEDLQRQGIPAVKLDVTHASAMRSAKSVEAISKLVLKELQRWETTKIVEARKSILAN